MNDAVGFATSSIFSSMTRSTELTDSVSHNTRFAFSIPMANSKLTKLQRPW
jgi:hypothetical protein